MKENKDYKLIEFNKAEESIDDHWTVEFLTGKFEGVKIQYGTITIDEETEFLNFNYEIVDNNGLDIKEENPELIECVKDVLSNVLSDALDLMLADNNIDG